ncbi:MAG: carboxypeptidase regulatory-like domain-containing protein, partial [Paludibacter sp.]
MKIIIHKKNLVTLLLTVSFFLANAQIRILPLGESTTCGQSNNSYRKALSDSILAYSVNFDYIGSIVGTGTGYDTDHQGMSGTPCSGLMDWVNNRSSAYNPEMILLWEGINDTGFFSKAKSTQQLRNLISTINTRWPNTEIFVSSIPNTTIDSLNKYVNALNDSMPGVVTAFQNVGVRIHFVNTIGVISTSELIDAVHPTTAAYLKMAPYWFNAIKPFFGTGNITGNVSFNSTGLAGVTLSFENRSVVTDANGNYTFYNVPNGSYTLTASLGGYSIPTAPVTMSGTTISNQNFVATLVAPSAPTSLRAVPSNNQITLTWTACTGTTGYTVKRATANGGPFTNVATNITSATYADTGLTNGTCYFYVVSASNGAGEGPNSTQVALSPTAFARPIIEFKFNDSPQFIQNTGSIGKSGFFEKASSYSANALGLTTSANDYALNLTTGGSGSFSKDSIGTALNGLTQFTATMWYKPGAIGKTGTLFNMSGVGGVRINNASGQFQFVEGLQTAWYNAPSIANVANTTNWEFIAFTYNAGVIKFFHGTPTAFTGSETLSGGSSPASLGTLSWAFRVGFNGYESLTTGSLMDNFRLYTTALAATDIQNIYNTDLAAVGGQVYTVSGTVTAGGSPISGVSVTDGARIATTDANGNYTITAVPPGTFTITPTKAGYYFTPSSQLVTVSSGNLSGKNFAATLIPTYSVSGTVTVNSTGLAGITISDGTRSAITDVSGNYTITNIPNGNYSLTPTKHGYTFTPTTLSATVNSANLTSKNFAATAISGPFISDNFDSYSPAT